MGKITIERRMISHMAFDNCHMLKHEYTIKGLLTERKFYGEIKTKKRKGFYGKFGKSESFYYFEDTPEGEEFKTKWDLLKSLGITEDMINQKED